MIDATSKHLAQVYLTRPDQKLDSRFASPSPSELKSEPSAERSSVVCCWLTWAKVLFLAAAGTSAPAGSKTDTPRRVTRPFAPTGPSLMSITPVLFLPRLPT